MLEPEGRDKLRELEGRLNADLKLARLRKVMEFPQAWVKLGSGRTTRRGR